MRLYTTPYHAPKLQIWILVLNSIYQIKPCPDTSELTRLLSKLRILDGYRLVDHTGFSQSFGKPLCIPGLLKLMPKQSTFHTQ